MLKKIYYKNFFYIMIEDFYQEIYDISSNNNGEKKINTLIMKKNSNNLIFEINKEKIDLQNNGTVRKENLLKLINNLKENDYNIKYLLKYNLKKYIFDINVEDDDINSMEIIHKIEDINFKDDINLCDCLIIIIEKKEFLKIKNYVKKKNGTKKLKK